MQVIQGLHLCVNGDYTSSILKKKMGTVFFQGRFELLPPTPLSVSGLVIWLDGDDPSATGSKPSNGTAISSWVDKSQSGMITSFTQATVGNRPVYASSALNSRGGVTFTGSSSHSISTTMTTSNLNLGTNTFTMFFVLTGATGGSLLFRGDNPGIWTSPNKKLWLGNGTTIEGSSGLYPSIVGWGQNYVVGASPASNPFILTVVGNTSAPRITYYRNSATSADSLGTNTYAPISDGSITGLTIGIGQQSPNLTGTLCEMLVYNKILSADERSTITNILAQKYNITVT